VLTFLAGLAWQRTHDASLQRIRGSQVLRVGYAVEAPFAMVQGAGRVAGAFPEVARQLAERLQLGTVEWVQMPIADLIPALQERRVDVVAAGLFITQQRQQQVRFSLPLVQVRPGWLTATGNPHQLGRYAAVAGRTGLRLAVLQGSVEQAELQAVGLGGDSLLAVPDAQVGRAMVLAGRAHGLALSLPTVRMLAEGAAQQLQPVACTTAGDGPVALAAFAFHRDDRSLADAWDQGLLALRASPAHRTSMARFGFQAEDLPR
jgi:polar amino acid transport system substrate-binding protein